MCPHDNNNGTRNNNNNTIANHHGCAVVLYIGTHIIFIIIRPAHNTHYARVHEYVFTCVCVCVCGAFIVRAHTMSSSAFVCNTMIDRTGSRALSRMYWQIFDLTPCTQRTLQNAISLRACGGNWTSLRAHNTCITRGQITDGTIFSTFRRVRILMKSSPGSKCPII
jgi:hypothetical protein